MIELSKRERGMLWMLVRKEAVSLGYGKRYTEENHTQWPDRLKKLRIIAGKLRQEIYELP